MQEITFRPATCAAVPFSCSRTNRQVFVRFLIFLSRVFYCEVFIVLVSLPHVISIPNLALPHLLSEMVGINWVPVAAEKHQTQPGEHPQPA